MKERILITGATGTVGTALIKKLSNLNLHIRAGVHSLIKGENLKYPNVELCEIEYERPESLKVAHTGVDRVFMITPFAEDQVETGKKIIDAAKDCGVKHFVKLSALGAGAEPGIQLGRWHREVEEYLENSGLPFTILRPASFMQNFVNYSGHGIRQNNAIYLPMGNGPVSYVDVRDIAEVASEVLTTDNYFNQHLDITGPEAVTMQEVAEAISKATGRTIQYEDVPEEAARQSMQEMPQPLVDAMLELYQISKAGHAALVANTTEKITGHKGHTIQDFARQYAECFHPDYE